MCCGLRVDGRDPGGVRPLRLGIDRDGLWGRGLRDVSGCQRSGTGDPREVERQTLPGTPSYSPLGWSPPRAWKPRIRAIDLAELIDSGTPGSGVRNRREAA